jgi:hypothetical protein
MNNTFFIIQGFNNDGNAQHRVAIFQHRGAMDFVTTRWMDGFKLDELQIHACLCCKKDVEDLIKLLEIHKHCFTK